MTHHHSESTSDHQCGCPNRGGCGGGGCCQAQRGAFTPQEREFLLNLLERQFLPMAQFVVTSTQTHEFEMVALSPVYLEQRDDTMEVVRERGDMIHNLEHQGLLTLDFDIPLDPLSYEIYEQSALFALLQETVEEGQKRGGYLGDQATIQQGSIAITQACIQQFSGGAKTSESN